MKRLKLLLFLSLGYASITQAQTAVFICESTQTYGYCNGYTFETIKDCAYQQCLKQGGKEPKELFSSREFGCGAIAVGTNAKGKIVLGVAVGYDNYSDAKERAKKECIKAGGKAPVIKHTWDDTPDCDCD